MLLPTEEKALLKASLIPSQNNRSYIFRYREDRALMRGFAMQYRIAIHPDNHARLKDRVHSGIHALKLAVKMRNLSHLWVARNSN